MSNSIKEISEGFQETLATPSSPQISLPSFNCIGKKFWKVFKVLGRIGAGAIILFALAHFVPELRTQMPNFYRLVDFIITAIEWVYTKFWAIIT